jgi:branched-chain amino acid transport system permease protein
VSIAFVLDLAADYAVFLVPCLGLSILLGAGQLSLGQGALVGLGAYGSALLSLGLGVPLPVALGGGALVSGLAGWALFGGLATRLGSFEATLGSLALSELMIAAALGSDWLGGASGLVRIPRATTPLVALAAAAGALLAALWLDRGPPGLIFRAVRDQDRHAALAGIDVSRTKRLAWLICGLFAGLGGALHAHRTTVLTPGEFGLGYTVLQLLACLIGGRGNLLGTALGALFIVIGPWLTVTGDPRDQYILFGAAITWIAVRQRRRRA